MSQRKYNRGDRWINHETDMRVVCVAAKHIGHTTALTLEIQWPGNATVRTLQTNAHQMTRFIRKWSLEIAGPDEGFGPLDC
jgi:hypothetical protein